MGDEILGRTLGIVGLGHTGRELVRLVAPFASDAGVGDCDGFFPSSADAIVKGISPRTRPPASAVSVGSDKRMN